MKKEKIIDFGPAGKLVVPCEIYSRVVGYYRPVNQWNKGQQEQFSKRKYYNVPQDSSFDMLV